MDKLTGDQVVIQYLKDFRGREVELFENEAHTALCRFEYDPVLPDKGALFVWPYSAYEF